MIYFYIAPAVDERDLYRDIFGFFKGNFLQTLVRGSGIPSMSGENLGAISIKYFDVFTVKIYRKVLLGLTHIPIKWLQPRSIVLSSSTQ